MRVDNYAESLTLDQLRVLRAIHETGSFTKAARTIQRSQGAISYQVAALETALELELFDRSTRRPTLTPAGIAITEHAFAVLDRVDELRRHGHRLVGGVEPRVTLAVDALFPTAVLARGAAEFKRAFPEVPLEIHSGILRYVPERIADETCVVGISGMFELPTHFVRGPTLLEVQLVPVVSTSHPLAALPGPVGRTTLAGFTHILVTDTPPRQDPGELAVEPRSAAASNVWRVSDFDTRLQLLKNGLGWSRVPRHHITEELASGDLVELTITDAPGRITVPLFVLHAAHAIVGPATTWLLDRLAEHGGAGTPPIHGE